MNKYGLTLVDTNVLLRYLLDDNEEMGIVAEQIIEGGAWTRPEMLAEVTFVLSRAYNTPRSDVAAALNIIANHVLLEPQDVCMAAIKVFENSNLDFVDCIMVAYRDFDNCKIFTFDKGIINYNK